MGQLTTHVLNIAAGIPAAGMRVDLRAAAGSSAALSDAAPVCTAHTDGDGRCPAPLLQGAGLAVGRYSLTFHVAAYFRALGHELPDPPYLDEVTIAVGIADPRRNYHVALLVSPWSYSTYRGS